MCSIFGVIGPTGSISELWWDGLVTIAGDRGRDGGRWEAYQLFDGWSARLGNWRATPTPEVERAPLQPYDGLVHNGTIANDAALGARAGEVDSMVLPRIVNRCSLEEFVESLQPIVGSYALACVTPETVLAAVNYKPLHYATIGGAVYFSSMARHFDGRLPFGVAPVAVPPYSAVDFRTKRTRALLPQAPRRVFVIASAGLDSTVVATKLVRDGWTVTLLHFAYGCRASGREHEAVGRIGAALGCEVRYLAVDLRQQVGGSALYREDVAFAEGAAGAEFAHEWVPARNLIFVALAVAAAEAGDAHAVALGNNLEEAGAYPDNEEQFTTLLDGLVPYAVKAGYQMRVMAPVGHLMKHEIVRLGLELGAPLAETWSCYGDGPTHCGACGPCFMRREAFRRNGVTDPVFSA